MIAWIVERVDYEAEGCPEHSSEAEEVIIGEDAAAVEAVAVARAEELEAGAYALTEYYAHRVWTVRQT